MGQGAEYVIDRGIALFARTVEGIERQHAETAQPLTPTRSDGASDRMRENQRRILTENGEVELGAAAGRRPSSGFVREPCSSLQHEHDNISTLSDRERVLTHQQDTTNAQTHGDQSSRVAENAPPPGSADYLRRQFSGESANDDTYFTPPTSARENAEGRGKQALVHRRTESVESSSGISGSMDTDIARLDDRNRSDYYTGSERNQHPTSTVRSVSSEEMNDSGMFSGQSVSRTNETLAEELVRSSQSGNTCIESEDESNTSRVRSAQKAQQHVSPQHSDTSESSLSVDSPRKHGEKFVEDLSDANPDTWTDHGRGKPKFNPVFEESPPVFDESPHEAEYYGQENDNSQFPLSPGSNASTVIHRPFEDFIKDGKRPKGPKFLTEEADVSSIKSEKIVRPKTARGRAAQYQRELAKRRKGAAERKLFPKDSQFFYFAIIFLSPILAVYS